MISFVYKLIVLLSLTITSGLAYGGESVGVFGSGAKFTYKGAKLAYEEKARTPTQADLEGTWVRVGSANKSTGREEYYPDGKYKEPGYSGFFYFFETITFGDVDAFGNPFISVHDEIVGAESGKIYKTWQSTGRLTNDEFLYTINWGNDIYCANEFRCKILDNVNMLLCKQVSTDPRKPCGKIGVVQLYEGFHRFTEK